MIEIKIGGRVVPLLYTTMEMIAIQREIGCTSFQLKEDVFGLYQEDEDDPKSLHIDVAKDADKVEKLCKLIRILGNAGLEEAGEPADLTNKKVMRAMKPSDMIEAINACMDAMNEGMASEVPERKKEGPVDVVLEEIEKKKERTD